MAVTRHIGWLTSTLLAVALLGACGGSDDDPTIKPTTAAPSSASATPDADGFTPDQREVADAVLAYTKAFFGRGANPVQPAVEGLVTQKVLDGLVPAETKAVDDAGLQYIGEVTVKPQKVTIDKDTATFEGCRDGSKAFIVKKGETSPGVGSRNVSTSKMTFKLVRQDGRWLINEPRGEQVSSC